MKTAITGNARSKNKIDHTTIAEPYAALYLNGENPAEAHETHENILCSSEPVDISTVKVEQGLSKQDRIAEYVRQIKDPLHYKCGKFTITAYHPENGPSLEDCLQAMMT